MATTPDIYKRPKDFIRVYMEAYRLEKPTRWVAAKLGVETKQVTSFAIRLRKRGVKLPVLARPTNRNLELDDVNQLNQMVEGLRGNMDEQN